jgi:hypothetical protein
VAYDQNITTPQGPGSAAGQPNATNAAASSIEQTTWPYKRFADRAVPGNIILRPLAPVPVSDDPTIDAINELTAVMEQVARSTRLISAPWLIEPPDAESFHLASGIVIPAQDGAFHTVVTITCPPGRNGVLNQIANVVVGGAWSDFSGDAVWQLVRNQSLVGAQTMAERNYQNILASLGLINAPAPISPIRLFENDVIALVIKNVALPVAGEEVGGLLGGYFYPRTWDDQFDAQSRNVAW